MQARSASDPAPRSGGTARGLPAGDGPRAAASPPEPRLRHVPEIEIIRRRPHRPTEVEPDGGDTAGRIGDAIARIGAEDAGTCPFVELNDARCSRRLRLGSIDDAFAYCFGGYGACGTYRHLTGSEEAPPAPVRLTVGGHVVPRSARAGRA